MAWYKAQSNAHLDSMLDLRNFVRYFVDQALNSDLALQLRVEGSVLILWINKVHCR